jgi:hypothetical protein
MRIVLLSRFIIALLAVGLLVQQGHASVVMGSGGPRAVLFGGPTPTPAPPRPTLTPITWTLENLSRSADVIAEVEPLAISTPDQYTWQSQDVIVRKWLKKPNDVLTTTLQLSWPTSDYAQLPASYRAGKPFILFLSVEAFFPYMYPDYSGPVDRCTPHYWARLIGEVVGQTVSTSAMFELAAGRVAYAGIPRYKGWTADAFEKAILANVARVTSEQPDPAPAELRELASKSEIIADVGIVSQDAGVGRYFATLYVRKWYKQPLDMNDDIINMSYGTNGTDPHGSAEVNLADSEDHRIIFLPLGNSAGRRSLGGYYTDVYGIKDGRIVSGKIDHYMGWTRERFEAALQAVLPKTAPDPPVNMVTLAHQADAIAIVHLYNQADERKSKVKEWLLNPPSARKDPSSSPTIVIPIEITHRAACLLPAGDRDYLVFLHEQPKDRFYYDYNRYQIIGGHIGLFELNTNTIGYAGLRQYSGIPRDLFEVAIRRMVNVLATTRSRSR